MLRSLRLICGDGLWVLGAMHNVENHTHLKYR